MRQRIPQSQLAKDLVLFFENPTSTQWLEILQDDFAYVIIKKDFQVTLNEDKPLILHLDNTTEIPELPKNLSGVLSRKLLDIFGG